MRAEDMARLVYGTPFGDDEEYELVEEDEEYDDDDDYEWDYPQLAFGDPGRADKLKALGGKALKSKALKKMKMPGGKKKKKIRVRRKRRGRRTPKRRGYSRGGVRISQAEVKQIVMLCLHKAIASMAK